MVFGRNEKHDFSADMYFCSFALLCLKECLFSPGNGASVNAIG